MVYYAILKTGATVVPINVLSTGREISYYLNNSDAKAFLCFQGSAELPMAENGFKGFQGADCCEHFWVIMADPEAVSAVAGMETLSQLMAGQSVELEMAQTSPDDTAVILYTSGTTGTAKGAELSHSSMLMNAYSIRELLTYNRDDVHIVSFPFFHSAGQTGQMNAGFSAGGTLVLLPRFTPEAALEAMQNEAGTVFAGVPTAYWALLSYEDREGSFDLEKIADRLRLGLSGGASMPTDRLIPARST